MTNENLTKEQSNMLKAYNKSINDLIGAVAYMANYTLTRDDVDSLNKGVIKDVDKAVNDGFQMAYEAGSPFGQLFMDLKND